MHISKGHRPEPRITYYTLRVNEELKESIITPKRRYQDTLQYRIILNFTIE